jgi:RNA polymerase sigma-70 factor, ECF subfamily
MGLMTDPAMANSVDGAGERFLRFVSTRDGAILDGLLQEHLDRSFTQAFRLLGSRSDSEDAVQEAFMNLVRTCDRYDGAISFPAWLGCLVHNAAVSAYRRRGVRSRHERHQAAADLGMARPEESSLWQEEQAVRAAVNDLPEPYRAAIDLHYFSGLSQGDTARALGIKENAVAKRLQRARDYLRSLLKKRGVATASVAALGLLSAHTHAAPASLQSNCTVSVLMSTMQAASPKALSAGVGFGLKGFAVVGALVLFGAAGIWQAERNEPDMRAQAAGIYERTWNFDRADDLNGLRFFRGSYYYRTHGGIGDSGCFEFEHGDDGNTGIVFDIGTERLPLKITFKVSPGRGEGGLFSMTATWDRWAKFAFLQGFYQKTVLKDISANDGSAWMECCIYLTKRSADVWVEKERSSFSYTVPRENAHVILNLMGSCRFDDLTIHQLTNAEVPADIAPYLDAVEKIPPDRQSGEVEVPGFEPQRIRFLIPPP